MADLKQKSASHLRLVSSNTIEECNAAKKARLEQLSTQPNNDVLVSIMEAGMPSDEEIAAKHERDNAALLQRALHGGDFPPKFKKRT